MYPEGLVEVPPAGIEIAFLAPIGPDNPRQPPMGSDLDVVKNIVSGKLVIQFGFKMLAEHLVEGSDLA
jgi:hypothetical protein